MERIFSFRHFWGHWGLTSVPLEHQNANFAPCCLIWTCDTIFHISRTSGFHLWPRRTQRNAATRGMTRFMTQFSNFAPSGQNWTCDTIFHMYRFWGVQIWPPLGLLYTYFFFQYSYNMMEIYQNISTLFWPYISHDSQFQTLQGPLRTHHDLSPDLPGGWEVSREC